MSLELRIERFDKASSYAFTIVERSSQVYYARTLLPYLSIAYAWDCRDVIRFTLKHLVHSWNAAHAPTIRLVEPDDALHLHAWDVEYVPD